MLEHAILRKQNRDPNHQWLNYNKPQAPMTLYSSTLCKPLKLYQCQGSSILFLLGNPISVQSNVCRRMLRKPTCLPTLSSFSLSSSYSSHSNHQSITSMCILQDFFSFRTLSILPFSSTLQDATHSLKPTYIASIFFTHASNSSQ